MLSYSNFLNYSFFPGKARKETFGLVKGSFTDMDPPEKSSSSPGSSKPLSRPPELHQSDADEDDENVKQLGECSSVYLALQVCVCVWQLKPNNHP